MAETTTKIISLAPTIQLVGSIHSDIQGIETLLQFYRDASSYKNCKIVADCYNMDWVDGNLSALLHAIDHRLMKDSGVQIVADFNFLAKKFGVLFRNGWLKHNTLTFENGQSTLPCTSFLPHEIDKFFDYIKSKLLCHKGTGALSEELRKQIQSNLTETFINFQLHAKSEDPLFVCGQFHEKVGYFIFTMVDLGLGFLPPIQAFTKGEVNTHAGAIQWALDGNSTFGEDLAGLGLEGIQDYCRNHRGGLQIVSGTAYWGTDLLNTIWKGHRPLKEEFRGTLINLFFPVPK